MGTQYFISYVFPSSFVLNFDLSSSLVNQQSLWEDRHTILYNNKRRQVGTFRPRKQLGFMKGKNAFETEKNKICLFIHSVSSTLRCSLSAILRNHVSYRSWSELAFDSCNNTLAQFCFASRIYILCQLSYSSVVKWRVFYHTIFGLEVPVKCSLSISILAY